jgi:hypothetical protein
MKNGMRPNQTTIAPFLLALSSLLLAASFFVSGGTTLVMLLAGCFTVGAVGGAGITAYATVMLMLGWHFTRHAREHLREWNTERATPFNVVSAPTQ